MLFAKRLRQGIKEGRITCTVRIWQRPHVKVGGIYPMEDGHVVESIRRIALDDITGALARRSGFMGVVDLEGREARQRHEHLDLNPSFSTSRRAAHRTGAPEPPNRAEAGGRRRRNKRPSIAASPAPISAMPAKWRASSRSPSSSAPNRIAVIGIRKVTSKELVAPAEASRRK